MTASGALVQLPMASGHRGPLSPACAQCAEGKKMVLFVTGLCRYRCFYCPVSERRNQKDLTYANERLVLSDQDVLDEARAIGAEGTGITGGDPLGVFDRTRHFVELLKREFGPSHHIHLYTHEPNPQKLERLALAGLDEFRLHIPHHVWGPLRSEGSAYRSVLEAAPSWGIRRGVEVPVIPGRSKELVRLLKALDGIGVDFVNLNELELSETNEAKFHERGLSLDPRGGWGIRGSREIAERILKDLRLSVPVHYCSSRFKDGVQLKQRLLRSIAFRAPPFAISTGEGTLLLGIVEAPDGADLAGVEREVARLTGLARPDYRVDPARRRVELGPRALRRVARRLAFPAFVVEEYPTADPLEVERTPLNFLVQPVGGT